MAGYSGTPLVKKLGYKSQMRVHLINEPQEYFDWVTPLPDVQLAKRAPFDLVHLFVNDSRSLERHLKSLRERINQNGMIWVSWYKKASKLPTELTEDVIRDTALGLGLVDVKVCSVTENWSGLKVVIRKELRTS